MKRYIQAYTVYYNTQNLPKQPYKIVSHLEREGRWTSQKMIEQTMYPWKNVRPDREISYYEIEGEDGQRFRVEGDVLLHGIMNRTVDVTNARIEGYQIKYWR